jgi:hypothetical protein
MKTMEQVVKERSEYSRLIRAVVSRIGKESIEDVINHGIDGGFGGFVYHSDTTKFFRKYRADIIRMAGEMSSNMGEDMLEMIRNFNCLGHDDYSVDDIARAIYQGKGEMVDQIQNAMAWFAAEEVCRMFEN